jgi:hypothetical protein
MTRRRAYILLFAVACFLQLVLTAGLALLGAGTDLLVFVYMLIACGASFGVGLIGTHYD